MGGKRPQAKERWQPPGAGRTKNRFSSKASGVGSAFPTPWFEPGDTDSQTSGLQIYDRMSFCGFKPPNLWKFVTTAVGNIPTLCVHSRSPKFCREFVPTALWHGELGQNCFSPAIFHDTPVDSEHCLQALGLHPEKLLGWNSARSLLTVWTMHPTQEWGARTRRPLLQFQCSQPLLPGILFFWLLPQV
jgi:hypothetical protein